MEILVYLFFCIPPIAIAICTILLWRRCNLPKSAKQQIILLYLVVGISTVFYAQYYNPWLAEKHSWGFDFLFCLISPFSMPVCYLFYNRLTKAKRIPLRDVIAFIPTLIYLAMLVTAQILMSGVDRHAYICNVVQGQSIQIDSTLAYDWMVMIGNRIYKIFIPIQAIIVMIYCEFRINIYFSKVSSQHITNVSSHITRIRWLHVMTMLMAAFCLLISVIPSYELAKEMWIVGPVLILEVVFVSLSVAHANKVDDPIPVQVEVVHDNKRQQAFVPNVPNIPNVIRQPERVAPAQVEAAPSLIARIDAAMENERLYLSQDLSLISMAEKIGTNRTYISKAIKDAKGCNFSDYVNRYRLDYAIYLLKKTPKNDIIIQNIAVQCGCGSIQTFYRYFKLFFNETPTQWIEKNK